jgi:hypothetical protein
MLLGLPKPLRFRREHCSLHGAQILGVVVPGCVQCKLRMETDNQFKRHLEEKVCKAIETA